MKVDLFQPQEKFLILEITPKGTHGLFLTVDDDRNLIFEKIEKNIDLKKYFKFFKSPVRSITQKAWEGEQLFKSRRKVIAAADPSVATTIPIPVELPRESPNEKITVLELENMIAQAMQKIFNGCRSEAAKRIGIDDIHTILVGAKAKSLKVDGKETANPAGLTGKNISLLLELTFTSRELFESLKQFFNSPEDFSFVEGPQAHLNSLSRVRKLPINLLVAEPDGTSLYVFEEPEGEYPVLYREKLNWRFNALIEKIMESLSVSEASAKELYHSYRQGEMSDDAKRAFKRVIQPIVESFFSEIEKGRVNGPVYSDMPDALPFDLPYRHMAAVFEEHPIQEVLAELGFSADFNSFKGDKNTALRSTLYFLEAYFDKSNSEINQKLRRRLHWLTI